MSAQTIAEAFGLSEEDTLFTKLYARRPQRLTPAQQERLFQCAHRIHAASTYAKGQSTRLQQELQRAAAGTTGTGTG
jgi:hypothetical protein